MSDTIFAPGFSEQPLWWNDAAPTHQGGSLTQDDVDVVVVGSGYAGLSCAHELAKDGLSVSVIDAGKCGVGASTRNAGFLSGRAGVSKQINLQALVGREHANRIFDEADEAYQYLQQLVAAENIDCNIDKVGRFVGAHTPRAFDKLAAKMGEYNRDSNRGFRMVSRAEQQDYVDSDYWYGGMFAENAGTLHPSRYHQGLLNLCLAAGVNLISDNRVLGIVDTDNGKQVHSEQGTLRARQVVLATNGYTDSLSPWHQKRLIPISSTLVASEEIGAERVRVMLPRGCPVIDTKRVICLARPSPDGKRILFGGRARFSPMGSAASAKILHAQLLTMFPQMHDIKVTNAWSGYMGFTFDFMPKIGIHEGVHYAVGCNGGCGIVMMSWLGRQVAQKILGSAVQPSAFEGLAFKTRPLYAGKPWFLPVIGNWWRLRDWIELSRARRGAA
jgi:glycine/D-amino acid oxidase-like deaminating enzyme